MRKSEVIRKAHQMLLESQIKRPPVDVIRIANTVGVHVKEVELPDDVSGVLQRNGEENAVIFVNKDHAMVRRRFSIAHELAHYYLHPNDGVHIDKKNYMFRDQQSHKAVDPIEIEANLFAAELLMPQTFIEHELRQLSEEDLIDTDIDIVEKLANDFNVSVTAMSIKFQNMGYTF